MVSSLSLRAPAKINLFLHINRQRPDGYHDLQTVFQFLDLADQLQFQRLEEPRIELQGSGMNVDAENNLITRAAIALQAATGCRLGARIQVDKHIPVGGGVGGGSSDAASTLLALNALWKTGLNLSQLATMGAKLGADVPVFIQGKAAFAEGTGGQLTPVDVPTPWYLLLKPACEVSTASIFSQQELTRNTSPIKIAAFLSGATCTRNDCLPIAQKLYPEIRAAMDWLESFSKPRLTGTGACIFAEFKSKQGAETVLQQVPKPWQAFVTQGLNTSPAHDDLAKFESEVKQV
ncbi:MAG: 4-(cytidine 5'-diphospho)-2-C-methyl-D-erythritol kinase [Pseudomonadales bacterium]